MGNKQEEIEICVRSQGHNLIATTETWWDSSHDWNAVIDGYTLFRKDRSTRPGGGVALYVREQLECIELCLGADEKQTEILWVRIKRQPHMGDVIVGVCYRPPDQEEEVDKTLGSSLVSWAMSPSPFEPSLKPSQWALPAHGQESFFPFEIAAIHLLPAGLVLCTPPHDQRSQNLTDDTSPWATCYLRYLWYLRQESITAPYWKAAKEIQQNTKKSKGEWDNRLMAMERLHKLWMWLK